jgi:hypothetical protein
MQKIIRQGDVLLIAVDAIPKWRDGIDAAGRRDPGLRRSDRPRASHRADHRAAEGARMVSRSRAFFCKWSSRPALTHEEHAAVTLDAPIYRQIYQVEERGEEVRRVAD